MDMHLKNVDLLLDLREHTIPLLNLRQTVYDFVKDWDAAKEGCDVGFRKEAIVFDTARGMIICSEKGSVRGRFCAGDAEGAATTVLQVLGWICTQFAWDLVKQELVMDLDIAYEIPMQDPAVTLESFVNKEMISQWLGLTPTGIGYKFFLTPFSDRNNDRRIQVEPSASDPLTKCFVHVKDLRISVSAGDVQSIVSNTVQLVRDIATKVSS